VQIFEKSAENREKDGKMATLLMVESPFYTGDTAGSLTLKRQKAIIPPEYCGKLPIFAEGRY
jgi:hypothetical protein